MPQNAQILASLDFKAVFRVADTPNPRLALYDITDYDGTGQTQAKTLFKCVAPDGTVFYENAGYQTDSYASPDTNEITAPGVPKYVDLPLDSAGAIVLGDYTVYMKLRTTDGVGDNDYGPTDKAAYNYCYERPDVVITQTVNCFTSTITSVDTTTYDINGTDQTQFTRQHLLYYPAGLQVAPEETATTTITVSPIYSQTWTTVINTTVEYSYGSGWYVLDTITGSEEIKVSCDINLCAIYCGLETLNARYLNAAANNFSERGILFEKITRVLQLSFLFQQAQMCGQEADANRFLEEIYVTGEFSRDCTCDGDEPVRIVALAGGGDGGDVTVIGTGGITVIATSGVGGDVEYAVKLSDTYKNKIDALYNAVVATSTADLVTITPSVVGYVTTYSIAVAIPNLHITTAMLNDLSVTAGKLVADSVITAKILDLNVTTAKINDLAVTAGKLAADSVTTAKILDLNVTTAKINDLAVTAGKIAADAVITAKILDLNVTTAKLADLAVTAAKIANGTITAGKMGLLSVSTASLIDASVTNAKLALLSVATGNIIDDAVTVEKLDNGLLPFTIDLWIHFDTNNIGTFQYYVPVGLSITEVIGEVTETIGVGGTAEVAITGAPFVMPGNVIFAAASPVGTAATVVAISVIPSGGHTLSIQVIKNGTAGGAAIIQLKGTRIA